MERFRVYTNYRMEYKCAMLYCGAVFVIELFVYLTTFYIADFPYRSDFDTARSLIRNFFHCCSTVAILMPHVTFLRYLFNRLNVLNSFLRFEII